MQHTYWLRTATVLAAVAAVSAAAQAAEGVFIKSDGITSPSVLQGAPADSYQASSFQWGVGRGIGNSGGRREVGPAMLSDITWTQLYDSSYNAMSERLLTHKVGKTDVLFGRTGQKGMFEASLEIKTTGSAFTALSVSSAGQRPSVSASQTFEQFDFNYKAIDPNTGKPGAPQPLGYDRETATLFPSGSVNRLKNERGNASSNEASGLYLRLGSGGNRIMGDSSDKGYEDWIKLDSFQMGMGIGVAPSAGAGGGFNFSQPSISEVTLSHAFDGAALAILADVLVGTRGRQATLELVERGGNGKPVTTMQLELDNVLFSGISFSSGGGLPSVSESLNFSGYTQRIWDIDPRTGLRSEQASVFSYDMLTGKVRDTAPAAFKGDGFFGRGNLNGLNTAASEIQLPPAGGTAPVPEPSTYAMLLLGLGGLGAVARRRAQRQGMAPLA